MLVVVISLGFSLLVGLVYCSYLCLVSVFFVYWFVCDLGFVFGGLFDDGWLDVYWLCLMYYYVSCLLVMFIYY